MGLDNFWKDEHDEPGFIAGEFKICGGILTDHGNYSFRGKVYDQIVARITGISLYEDTISAEQVGLMNEKIQECHHQPTADDDYQISPEEWTAFQRMWNGHTLAGHSLVSWY